MDELLSGYQRFRRTGWPSQRRRYELSARNAQHPRAMVLACCDSRVDPQTIFSARPGELFVARNVGNLAPPYQPHIRPQGTSASLEFGVRVLKVPQLVVLGHGMCGAVKALVEGPPLVETDFLMDWIAQASSARAVINVILSKTEGLRAVEQEFVRLSLRNLMGYPWIADAISTQELRLTGAYFDIRHGELHLLDADGEFRPAQVSTV